VESQSAREPSSHKQLCSALFALLLMEAGVTLLLPGSPGAAAGICYLNQTPSAIFMTSQGLMNIAMFTPIGFFALAATRSPLVALTGGIAVSTGTELAQATVFGRNCDSNDLAANTIGTFAGIALFCAMSAVSGRGTRPGKAGLKVAGVLAFTTVALSAAVVSTVVTLVPVEDSGTQLSSTAQREAADNAMRRAFDDHIDITGVSLHPGSAGSQDQLVISFKNGTAQLSWPDQNDFSALLEAESAPGENSFASEPSLTPPKRESDAEAIAVRYTEARYPHHLKNSFIRTFPVGEDAEFGWITSWRVIDDGVLLPHRLDVQVNRAGRISQLVVREFTEEYSLAGDRISETSAMKRVEEQVGITPEEASEHLLKTDGEYKPIWVVAIRHGPEDVESVFVDSITGDIVEGLGVT
ncbi:VanZ family protein, partial [Streptomyces albidoflavus]